MLYIGFRIEVASRILPNDITNIVKIYNKSANKILDLHQNGKITADKSNDIIIARGKSDKNKSKNGTMINFSIVNSISSKEELIRVVQIINVLGNGRLIRERIQTFIDRESLLNQIPELNNLYDALKYAEKLMPGLIKNGWYYAPEAYFEP